jgi:hypothetical protein
MTSLSSENFVDGLKLDITTSASETRSSMKVSILLSSCWFLYEMLYFECIKKDFYRREFSPCLETDNQFHWYFFRKGSSLEWRSPMMAALLDFLKILQTG